MMKVERVPVEWVHAVWPQVSGWVEKSAEVSAGEITASQIRMKLSAGEWLLFVAMDGASIRGMAAVEMQQRPNDRVAFVTAVGGRGLFTPECAEAFKHQCSSLGATSIEGAQSPSVARLWARLGAKPKYLIQEIRLTPESEARP